MSVDRTNEAGTAASHVCYPPLAKRDFTDHVVRSARMRDICNDGIHSLAYHLFLLWPGQRLVFKTQGDCIIAFEFQTLKHRWPFTDIVLTVSTLCCVLSLGYSCSGRLRAWRHSHWALNSVSVTQRISNVSFHVAERTGFPNRCIFSPVLQAKLNQDE